MKTTPADKTSPVVEKPFWLNFEFRLRRAGFFLLLLIVFAGAVGVFSRGYVSDARLENHDQSLTLNYDRFNRLTTDTSLKISSIALPGKPNRIILGGDFMDSFRIDSLQPQPDNMHSLNGKMIIEYKTPDVGFKQTLWLSLTPMKAGLINSSVAVDNGPDITFRQFVYP